MEYTENDVISLAAKLDGLELTDGERAAFAAALGPEDGSSDDGDDDVTGFALNAYLTLAVGEVVSQRAMSQLHSGPRPDVGQGFFVDSGECR